VADKQVIRGFSRQYLPREIFPIDYVDYKSWIRSEAAACSSRPSIRRG
jgi:hypothetical protein